MRSLASLPGPCGGILAPVHAIIPVSGGASLTSPLKSSHVASIEPKVRALVGADNVFVHDYFDWFDNQFSVQYGD